MKRWLQVIALVAVLGLVGTACAQEEEGGGGGGGTPSELPGAGVVVCEVSDEGGFDDKSFNQTAHKGVEDAQAELGITSKFLESDTSQDYQPNIQACLQENSNLIVTVGFKLGDDTAKAAGKNPDTSFAIVDFTYDPPIPNVEGLLFSTDQAAFLAGYLAAGMSETGKVGTYGGIPIPSVTIFMNGFWAGVAKYNEDNGTNVEVLGWDPAKPDQGTFSGDFTNEDNGRRIAEDFISEGVDIILPVAGPVGLGSAAAAQDAGNVSLIWVDTDGCVSAEEFCSLFLTSVEKKIDVAVSTAIGQVVDGTFQGGTNYFGTLENGGVDISPYHEFEAAVPQELKDKIDELKQGIIDGTVSVDPADYS